MSNAAHLLRRLLEDEPPVAPEQPEVPEQPGEEEDVRDLLLHAATLGTTRSDGVPFGTQAYEKAAQKLGTRASRKIANHTYLKRLEDGSVALRLHETDIITWKPNGDVVVDTGGWFTRTTLDRLSGNLPGGWRIFTQPFHIHGEEAPRLYWEYTNRYGYANAAEIKHVSKFFWYNFDTRAGIQESGELIPFTDGDTIESDGTLNHQEPTVPREGLPKRYQWP